MSAGGRQVSGDLSALYFRGSRSKIDLSSAITECTLDMSTTQVSQLSITVEDPGFPRLNAGWLDTGVFVDYRELRLQIATTEASGGSAGMGGVKVNARPYAVQKLKARTGALVMKNLSPSQFVAAECAKAGVKCYVQPSSKRKNISRDVPDKTNASTSGDKPSTWTTFNRLAGEIGFYCYEIAGEIVFESPAFLASRGYRVYVSWRYGDRAYWMPELPTFTRSVDNGYLIEASLTVPANRAYQFQPGKVVVVAGVPKFSGGYLITGINYSLMDMAGTATVTAQTPMNLLTSVASPIRTNVTFPKTALTKSLINSADASTDVVMTEPRRDTKSGRDFAYWCRYDIGDEFPLAQDVGLSAYNTEDGLSGSDLVNYGLLQIGLPAQTTFESIRARGLVGTQLSIETALKTPGALLFAGNYIGISSNVAGVTLEPTGRFYRQVFNESTKTRWNFACMYPGMMP